jgi:hypothetical protein
MTNNHNTLERYMSHRSHGLAALALVLVACADQPLEPGPMATTQASPPTPASAFSEANAASDWNGVARGMIAANHSSPLVAIRGLAILSVAQYNAAVAAEQFPGPGVRPSVRAAIGAASVAVLSYLYPAASATLEARLDAVLAGPGWPGDRPADPAAGEAIGREVGAAVVARAQGDGFFAPWSGTIPTGPGIWSSPNPPVGPGIGQSQTWFLLSGSQFRPAPPPAFNSPEFLAALAEVRQISDTRTPEQHALAVYWNQPAGTYTPRESGTRRRCAWPPGTPSMNAGPPTCWR